MIKLNNFIRTLWRQMKCKDHFFNIPIYKLLHSGGKQLGFRCSKCGKEEWL